MTADRLIWLFAGLFLFFGLLLAFVEDEASRRIWGGLAALSLGGFALTLARSGLKSGTIRFGPSDVRRADSPLGFRLAITLVITAGFVTLSVGLWALSQVL